MWSHFPVECFGLIVWERVLWEEHGLIGVNINCTDGRRGNATAKTLRAGDHLKCLKYNSHKEQQNEALLTRSGGGNMPIKLV